jgi:hypothetical protein
VSQVMRPKKISTMFSQEQLVGQALVMPLSPSAIRRSPSPLPFRR